MDFSEFAAVKQRVMGESFPSAGDDLDGMAIDFHGYLWRSPLIKEVSVRRTGDTNNLIIATCQTVPGCSMVELAAELERIWLRDLLYQHFEAHMIIVNEDGVRLDVVTQISADGFYVTAAIVAGMSKASAGGGDG